MLLTVLLFPLWAMAWSIFYSLGCDSFCEWVTVLYLYPSLPFPACPATSEWIRFLSVFKNIVFASFFLWTLPARCCLWHLNLARNVVFTPNNALRVIALPFVPVLYVFYVCKFFFWHVPWLVYTVAHDRKQVQRYKSQRDDEIMALLLELKEAQRALKEEGIKVVPLKIGGAGDCWRKLFPMAGHMDVMTLDFFSEGIKHKLRQCRYPKEVWMHFVIQPDGDWHLEDVMPGLFLKPRHDGFINLIQANELLDRTDKDGIVIGASYQKSVDELQSRLDSLYYKSVGELPGVDKRVVNRNMANIISDAYRNFSPVQRTRVHVQHILRDKQISMPDIGLEKVQRRNMTIASAMASARILLGSDGQQGTYQENKEAAFDSLGRKSINTSIPITKPAYKRLTAALGIPLNYMPGITGHGEAATCRRAWMSHMEERVAHGVVAMISPSLVEWHKNPSGVGYYAKRVDGVDRSRVDKPCAMCESRRCKVLAAAREDNRVAYGSMSDAIKLFKAVNADYLWMVNIEPNIHAAEVLEIMRRSGIENGFSCFHMDWDVLHSNYAKCNVTSQVTHVIGNKVISKFDDAGTYVQDFSYVKALFSPTFSGGCALRRTVLGRAGTSVLTELNVDHAGYGTGFVPDRDENYLIPVPHPTMGVKYLKIPREGFDRVMHVFRTVVDKSVDAAKTQLRQSNVTYSVSGTQLTPRLALSATDYELLAVWMVAYSEIMDLLAAKGLKEQRAGLKEVESKLERGSFAWAADNICKKLLSHSDERNPQLGSQSAVRRWLRVCMANGQFMTLDELSDNAYATVYGAPYVIEDGRNWFNKKYGGLVGSLSGLRERIAESLSNAVYGGWQSGFSGVEAVTRILLTAGSIKNEAVGMVLDAAFHCCRVAGVDSSGVEATRRYYDNIDHRVSHLWTEIVEAQALSFQAASVKIVEALVNVYSPDLDVFAEVEKAKQEKWEGKLNERMDEIPYNRFMTELKCFFAKINTRHERVVTMHRTLTELSERRNVVNHYAAANIDKLMSDAKGMLKDLPEAKEPSTVETIMKWAGAKTAVTPIRFPTPLMNVVESVDVDTTTSTMAEDVVKQCALVRVDEDPTDARFVKCLPRVDGTLDFSEIYAKMEEALPGYAKAKHHIGLPDVAVRQTVFSPDSKGSNALRNAVSNLATKCFEDPDLYRHPLATDEQLMEWCAPTADLPMVNEIKRKCEARVVMRPKPYLMHIDGLAMGGKSKGVRDWITSEDMVVVPTRKLKEEWIKALGELDPFRRASVYTQHTALKMNCSRYVIVDEAYTFGLSHLELLRRTPNAKGFITVGDGHQIGAIFDDVGAQLDPTVADVGLLAVAPVSFVPLTNLIEYLRRNRSPVFNQVYYFGGTLANGMHYVIDSDDYVLPGKDDLSINGLQNSKASMIARGVDMSITAHEAQGARSEWTIIHSQLGGGMCPDFEFLDSHDAHIGVALTRSRRGVLYVLKDKSSLKTCPGVDSTAINGSHVLPVDFLYGGSSWDLVDPVVIDTVTFDRYENENVFKHDADLAFVETNYTMGSLIDEERQEAIPIEAIKESDIPVDDANTVNTFDNPTVMTSDENMIFNPAQVRGAGLINMLERRTRPTSITTKDFSNAREIVKLLFDRVIDPKKFNAIAGEDMSAINNQSRSQVIKMTESSQSAKFDHLSFAFPKNEPSKKVMSIGKGMKILSVTAMNATQLMLFGDVAHTLTHAWSRSLRPGIITPVGFTRAEVSRVLGSLGITYELDIEKQDSCHSATHVAVFLLLIEMVAKRQGCADVAEFIRSQRTIGDMEGHLRIEMGTGLGSGDVWTLIANMIMAFSMLISRYDIPYGVRCLQVGDDITMDRVLVPREIPIGGSEGVVLKEIRNTSDSGRPSFTSNVSLNETTSMASRIRGIVKMCFSRRSRTQHIAYKVEAANLKAVSAELGLAVHAEVYAKLFGACPSAIEYLIGKACYLASLEYEALPQNLRMVGQENKCVVHSRDYGCFGFALAHGVASNVAAINAMSKYNGTTRLSDAVAACKQNKVEYTIVKERWKKRSSPTDVTNDYLTRAKPSPMIYLYSDHAVCVTSSSSEIVTFSGSVKYNVNLMTEEVSIIDNY